MPTFGALELTGVVDRLATVRDLDTEAWPLPGAEILQLAFEVPRDTAALLPRAMHPAIPPYATIWVTRYPESPVGPFTLAQIRLMGRAGAHPRGLVLGCTHFPVLKQTIARVVGPDVVLIDSAEAAAAALEDVLKENGLDNPGPAAPPRFLATDAPGRFAHLGEIFLGEPIDPGAVTLVDL